MLQSKSDISIHTFPVGALGCNCSIIYSEKSKTAILIDPGNDQEPALSFIQEKKLKIGHILHTHAHFDHIGESAQIRNSLKAKLCLHQGDHDLYANLKEQGLFFGFDLSTPGPVDLTLEHEMSFGTKEDLSVEGDLLKVVHTPGHTPGSCSFYCEAFDRPILLSGDTLFANSIGRTDFPGGDFNTIKKSIKEQIYSLPEETIVIPGHGPFTQIAKEKKSNPFVRS